jgi:hypothetical protein
MTVTVGELHDAFRDACNRQSSVAIVGDSRLPMELLDALLRNIELRIAPIMEDAGRDVETMRIEVQNLPACMCAASAKTTEETIMVPKDFGDAKYRDLKAAYKTAVEEGNETFQIGTVEFYTKYAKYLIEYLDGLNIPDGALLNSVIAPQ